MSRKAIKVKIRWTATSSNMWYEDMVGQTFYVTKNPTMDYYSVPYQGKIIFKTDAIWENY